MKVSGYIELKIVVISNVNWHKLVKNEENNMRKIIYGLCISLILGFLFLCPSLALAASRQGLQIWFETLLPTLLPFLILSGFLVRANLADSLVAFISPVLKKIFHISSYGCYAILIGFLCGFPMGAKVLSDLVKAGKIEHIEAQYLLGFCNNASPAFVITFLVTEQLGKPSMIVPTLLLVYGMPILWGMIQNPFYRKKLRHTQIQNLRTLEKAPMVQINFELIDACILDSVITITKLGGYIIMFSIIAKMTTCIPFMTNTVKACVTGVTELTNGIPLIANAYPFPMSYLILIPITCFGGLSALAQTESVIKSAHLSLSKYFISKICICILAASQAYLYLLDI